MVVRARRILLLIMICWLALGVLWLHEQRSSTGLTDAAKAYGQATWGPGLGSSATLDWSMRHMDPRLERGSNCDLFPLPGGPGFCPDQYTSLFVPPDDGHGLPRISAVEIREQ